MCSDTSSGIPTLQRTGATESSRRGGDNTGKATGTPTELCCPFCWTLLLSWECGLNVHTFHCGYGRIPLGDNARLQNNISCVCDKLQNPNLELYRLWLHANPKSWVCSPKNQEPQAFVAGRLTLPSDRNTDVWTACKFNTWSVTRWTPHIIWICVEGSMLLKYTLRTAHQWSSNILIGLCVSTCVILTTN
jgi:hypothetical protein